MKDYINTDHIPNIRSLAEKAIKMKNSGDSFLNMGAGKVLTCLYLNPSLRTRLSTEIAARKLGMECINLDAGSAWALETEEGVIMDGNAAEHIKEQALVLSRYSDIIAIRAFPLLKNAAEDYHHDFISKFSKHCEKPIINLESGSIHPLQALADLITILETQRTKKPKVVLTWAPHPRQLPQSVANSFSRVMQQADMDLTIACPEGMELSGEYTGSARVVHDQLEAFEGADYIYAKNWSSYQEYGRIHQDKNWIINGQKMERTNHARFMHCLPVRRNVVVTDEVLDSKVSLVGQQAENRIYAAQSVLKSILTR